jgi:hypothetical protein
VELDVRVFFAYDMISDTCRDFLTPLGYIGFGIHLRATFNFGFEMRREFV